MLCRVSTLRHPASGVSVSTPLLIPSFSSKGLATSRSGKSELSDLFRVASEALTETYLISAYDVYYEHLPRPEALDRKPELVFLDSGGYEVSTDRDYSSVIDPLPRPEPWDLDRLNSVLDAWPEHLPVIVVSYDHPDERSAFPAQAENARRFFMGREEHLSLLLLKPETKAQRTLTKTIRSVVADVEALSPFDAIGVTEKELGNSMLDRMARIAELRLAMDAADVKAPLHIFGALDPLSVPLYYMAGAEIFDGLTWLRYGYDHGVCVYVQNLGVERYGLHLRDDVVRARALNENYYALLELQERLREFETTGCFEKLAPHGQLMRSARDSLKARLKGRL
ncbi:MAG: hypothetical protein OXF79_19200 [Chloroflexi bacterium]|nr:hypothetical protein [Chloroflexota bacterium]